ncbi:hypothetical protein [uncultured Photobacterium sp.]|uniref:hypothetical protein n=1 Tax=uncultured Photobacterium sp. TaxID=173973 RepID=UPI002626FF7A|nr:hypothetical protein [uncultured Photobacterium sp.]
MSLRVNCYIFPLLGLMMSAGGQAVQELQCQPKWHNAMSLDDGTLNLDRLRSNHQASSSLAFTRLN